MKNRLNLSEKEKNTTFKDAFEEKPFLASNLIEELIPLLSDYFEGDFSNSDDKIMMSFYNGQKFVLTISEN